jgi:hypothetical protein
MRTEVRPTEFWEKDQEEISVCRTREEGRGWPKKSGDLTEEAFLENFHSSSPDHAIIGLSRKLKFAWKLGYVGVLILQLCPQLRQRPPPDTRCSHQPGQNVDCCQFSQASQEEENIL